MSSSVPGLIRKTASSARRKNRLAVSSRRKRAALRMRATPVHGEANAMTTGPWAACGVLAAGGGAFVTVKWAGSYTPPWTTVTNPS